MLAAAQMIQRPAFGDAISHAPGFSGTPVAGQTSIAASSASCVKSSASGTSRSIRDRLVISRGCSIRQTARIVRWMSAAVIAADADCAIDRPHHA